MNIRKWSRTVFRCAPNCVHYKLINTEQKTQLNNSNKSLEHQSNRLNLKFYGGDM